MPNSYWNIVNVHWWLSIFARDLSTKKWVYIRVKKDADNAESLRIRTKSSWYFKNLVMKVETKKWIVLRAIIYNVTNYFTWNSQNKREPF